MKKIDNKRRRQKTVQCNRLHQQNDKNLVHFLSFLGLFCLSYRPVSIHKLDKLDKNARLILN
jgi:hypothetical protein